jgi:hypothetical protein
MTNEGIVIYAHNSRVIDYARSSMVSGFLAKKYLKKSVTLITDDTTLDWIKESGLLETTGKIFDSVITTDKPLQENTRRLYNGNLFDDIPFFNANRFSAFDLTPYDKTLLIDSDFLIFSDVLNNFWNIDTNLMIGESAVDVSHVDRLGYHDKYISDVGIKMYWATTVMFDKSEESRVFFDNIKHIRSNYRYYADLYRFDPRLYRNDISFSISKHMLDGFNQSADVNLPPVLSSISKDILVDIYENGVKLLINENTQHNYYASSIKNVDIHVMNKQSIVKHFDKILSKI